MLFLVLKLVINNETKSHTAGRTKQPRNIFPSVDKTFQTESLEAWALWAIVRGPIKFAPTLPPSDAEWRTELSGLRVILTFGIF